MEKVQLPQSPARPVLKKTACAECRQQKMRCDGSPDSSNPPSCSRCRRLNITCVFSAPFTRTHKRKRMQELEDENASLKRRLLSASVAAAANPPPSGDAPHHRQDLHHASQNPTANLVYRDGLGINDEPTLPRAIDGLEVPSGIIDDCVELYFKDYHYLLPILDPSESPNTLYQHSPFLFWIIVSVGSRRYSRQPTMTQALARPVTQLILQSTILRNKPIERMQAILILLTWPFPTGNFYRDPTFLFAGALLHVAIHSGLHPTAFSQEVSTTHMKPPGQELMRRMELWAYIVTAYQRTCSGSGHANMLSFDIYNEQAHFKALLERLPVTVRLQLQISHIITRAHKALLDLGLLTMNPQQERTMDALLKSSNTEVDSLEIFALSAWDHFYIASARQELVVMHFYKSAPTLDMQTCVLIFNTVSNVLEQIRGLERDYRLHNSSTRFAERVTLLALASMARVLRGPFAGYLDQSRGHNLYESGILFMRSSSILKGDYVDKCSWCVEQMWKSKNIFRNPDGSTNITLRVRNRLSTGPWHDAIICWKEEFVDPECILVGVNAEGKIAPTSAVKLATTPAPSPALNGNFSDFPAASDSLLNDALWGDMGLGMDDSWDAAGLGMSMSWMS